MQEKKKGDRFLGDGFLVISLVSKIFLGESMSLS